MALGDGLTGKQKISPAHYRVSRSSTQD
jgi:hypothetical protein